jgi:1,4-dihydroxy-2-naphthoyl-CoA hydrolase
MSEQDEDFSGFINETRADNWVGANGLTFTRATRSEVSATLEVRPDHLQAYGIVHGGVHAGLIETLASVGAAIDVMPEGRTVVGLENHTSFIRAVRGGVLRATATPISRGRRSQVWEAQVFGDDGKLAATGRVRLLVLDEGAALAGEPAGLKP